MKRVMGQHGFGVGVQEHFARLPINFPGCQKGGVLRETTGILLPSFHTNETDIGQGLAQMLKIGMLFRGMQQGDHHELMIMHQALQGGKLRSIAA